MRNLLLAECARTPWALAPDTLTTLAQVIARWGTGQSASPAVLADVRSDARARAERKAKSVRAGNGAVAVLPLYGIITQRGNMVDDVSGPGSTSTQQFTAALRFALADDTVSAIVVDADSPGGSVYGVGELADEIFQARKAKPVYAVANSLAASAAYWICSQASEFYVTPGGEVGSIGVYTLHEDFSRAIDEAGVTTTFIAAGKFKTEGNPYEPLAPEAKGYAQSRINDYYGVFTRAVARGRNVSVDQVRGGMGQGRVLGARTAVAENMVDGVATLDDIVRSAVRGTSPAKALAAQNRLALMSRELDLVAGSVPQEFR